MRVIILSVFLIYFLRYRKAKKAGTVTELKSRVFTRYFWAISVGLVLSSPVIVYAAQPVALKFLAVITCILGVLVNPVVLRRSWRFNRLVAVILPVAVTVAAVVYIPFVLGKTLEEVLTLVLTAIILTCIAGALIDYLMIGLIVVLIIVIGYFSLPTVHVV